MRDVNSLHEDSFHVPRLPIQVVKLNHQLSWFVDSLHKSFFGEHQHVLLWFALRTYIKIFKEQYPFYHPVIYGPLARLICKSTGQESVYTQNIGCVLVSNSSIIARNTSYNLAPCRPDCFIFLHGNFICLDSRPHFPYWAMTLNSETARIITSKSKYNLHLEIFQKSKQTKTMTIKVQIMRWQIILVDINYEW